MLIIKVLIIWFLVTTIINGYLMSLPKLDIKKEVYPEYYHIQNKNRINIQMNYECAAFSIAYVLRHFSIEFRLRDMILNIYILRNH